jgi:hypothetical protein
MVDDQVADEFGSGDDQLNCAPIGITRSKNRGNPRQPVLQRVGMGDNEAGGCGG